MAGLELVDVADMIELTNPEHLLEEVAQDTRPTFAAQSPTALCPRS